MLLLVLILQIAFLVAVALVYHKLSAAIAAQRHAALAQSDNCFRQLEALLGLYTELKLDHALPPTRSWAASPDFLSTLARHLLRDRPRTIVECGSGVSSLVLARCLEHLGSGHVYSLEHEGEFAEATRSLIRQHGLERYATVLDAPLVDLTLDHWSGHWYRLDAIPKDLKIDTLVVDGPPSSVSTLARYPALPIMYQYLSERAFVFLDDADRVDEKAIVRRWADEFPEIVSIEIPKCEKGCVALRRQRRT